MGIGHGTSRLVGEGGTLLGHFDLTFTVEIQDCNATYQPLFLRFGTSPVGAQATDCMRRPFCMSKEAALTPWLCVPEKSTREARARLGQNGVMGPWRPLAAVLVVGLSVLFAVLFTHQRRRIRYLLRNRLTPLSVLSEDSTPIQRGLPWGLVGVVVVITLAVLAFA